MYTSSDFCFSNSVERHLNNPRGIKKGNHCFTCICPTDPIFCSYRQPQRTQKHIIVHYNWDLSLFLCFFWGAWKEIVHPCIIDYKSFREKSVCLRIEPQICEESPQISSLPFGKPPPGGQGKVSAVQTFTHAGTSCSVHPWFIVIKTFW